MGIKKLLLMVLLLLLVVNCVLAEDATYALDNPDAWDYNDPTFYNNIPIEEWDFAEVNWENVNNYQEAIDYLNDYGILEEQEFYNNDNFVDFLGRLEEADYNKIDINKVIAAGKGTQLKSGHIQANVASGQEGISDLTKLDPDQLDIYFGENYGSGSFLDVSGCQEGVCSLKDGVLANNYGDQGRVSLNDLNDLGSAVYMRDDGEIEVYVEDIESMGKFSLVASEGANYNLYLTYNFNRVEGQDPRSFNLIIDGVNVPVASGKFEINDGKVFILPRTEEKEYPTVITGVGIVYVDSLPDEEVKVELTMTRPTEDEYFERKIYLSKDELMFTGSDYSVELPMKNPHDSDNPVRNGYYIEFTPKANKAANIPSAIRLSKGMNIGITGDAIIHNDDNYIRAENGHFIDETRAPSEVGLREGDQRTELLNMRIYFEEYEGRELIVHDNRIDIGENTIAYSVQFNEEGKVEIGEYLGPKVDGDVIKPTIVVIGTRNEWSEDERQIWETNRNAWLINRRDDRPVIIFDLDKNTYTVASEGKIENQVLIEDMVEFANNEFATVYERKDYQFYFVGHSGVEGDEYVLVVGSEGNQNMRIKKETLAPTGTSRNNPIIAGCASEGFAGKKKGEGLDMEETVALNLYLVAKANSDDPENYNWELFVQDIESGKVKVPRDVTGSITSGLSCGVIIHGINNFYKDYDKEELVRKACLK